MNDNLSLICGKSASGKSACLKDIPNHEGVIYLNTESGKKLPFRNKFKKITITDPMQVYAAFDRAEKMPEVHTIVVDSLTYLMQMYEMVYVKTSTNTLQAWGTYADFFINLMQQYVAKSTKDVIFTAHTSDIINDEGILDTAVKVKGALMNNGIESWFSNILTCKRVTLKDLEPYESEFLNIDEDDKLNKFKYVFQTRLTEGTVAEKIRAPMGMWDRKETFIDNNIAHVAKRLHEFYDAED